MSVIVEVVTILFGIGIGSNNKDTMLGKGPRVVRIKTETSEDNLILVCKKLRPDNGGVDIEIVLYNDTNEKENKGCIMVREKELTIRFS